ncbi:hypothetical protein QF049_001054 [Paenibacillus sp. W4I10]|uniref:hypothetical protein n=1 Tax=Paenibacillus sp. W4I10 TaxID=3042298 RepID=UPI0027820F27|nr:hypothetical protein [Paenibacillus sp. W4I10]MDQ0719793.1 hypothetical protein [Paenibacillus sp. W4I10]
MSDIKIYSDRSGNPIDVSAHFVIQQVSRASDEKINEVARNACIAECEKTIKGWSNSPSGQSYKFAEVTNVRVEDGQSFTHQEPWPSNKRTWEYTANGVCNMMYTEN